MRACTHRDWAHRQRISTTFLVQKNSSQFFLCSWRWGSKPQVIESWVWRSTNGATPSPLDFKCTVFHHTFVSRSVSPTLHCIGCELNLKPQPPIQTVRFVLAATLRHVCITPAVKNIPCCTEEMASFSKPYLLLLFFWVDTDCSFAAEQLRIQRKNFGITLLKFRLEGLNKSVVYYYYYVIIVIVMRLRTGHSQPNAHVCRKFKLASSLTCDCSLEDQTSERLLQRYAPFVKEWVRRAVWPTTIPAWTKPYGNEQELEKMAMFCIHFAYWTGGVECKRQKQYCYY